MADFESKLEELRSLDVEVVAASVDELDDARKTVARHGLGFPVGYGLDAAGFAEQTGAFWDEAKGYVHATGFVLRPDGRVAAAVYSTGPIGRYVAADVVGLIRYLGRPSA